jgi:5-methylcytosine-specific restriction protein A
MPMRPPTFRPAGWAAAKRRSELDRRKLNPSYEWYGTSQWKGMSAHQLVRHPICNRCKREPATVANHVVPHRGDWKLFWHGELESVCKRCHDSIIQSEERRSRGAG